MKFVGVDLHKKTISICVMTIVDGKRRVVARGKFECKDVAAIREFFESLGPFQVVVEATAAYEWFFLLIEDLADRLVLAHPKKLRVIAESKHKSDRIDAKILAEFLAMDMIPQSWRPSPRVRAHRVLVRHRHYVQGRITSVKCKLRNKAAQYNADIAELFTARGERHLADLAVSSADRFEITALQQQLGLFESQLDEADTELQRFALGGPEREKEARAVLNSMPQIGPVTIDVVLSELGDPRRFRGMKRAVAYAGLDPGSRRSDSKSKQLGITKDGSRLLRWALVEAAWRLVGKYRRWESIFQRLLRNTGSPKKAIVGTARRLLGVMFSMLRSGQAYRLAAGEPPKKARST